MKKFLIIISKYFYSFLVFILMSSLFILYIMFVNPVSFWMGNASSSIGSGNLEGIVSFLTNDYVLLFLMPILPLIIFFILLSIFIWIFYRKDEEFSKKAFRNILVSIFVIFLLIIIPIKAGVLLSDIQYEKDSFISEFSDGMIQVNKGNDSEFLELYQTLADENIQPWRKDPVLVTKNEIENGELYNLKHGESKLVLESITVYESSQSPKAIVILENDFLKAEIWLGQYWNSDHGVWSVKSYKIIE